MIHGVLVIDKPEGPTSHDIVARARRALGIPRIGHTGTLDPMATGVLPLAIGQATRLVQFLSAGRKTYEATLRLGIRTDTYDRLGTIIGQADPAAPLPHTAAVEQALQPFRGTYLQTPPPFSAKKVRGVRAYERARRGETANVPTPASVHVDSLEVLAYAPPLLRLRVSASAGFYVRALAHDLGSRLGTGAVLDALRRTASGPFTIDRALSIEALDDAGAAAAAVVPLHALLPDWPSVVLTDTGLRRAGHGQDIGAEDVANGTVPVERMAGARIRLLSPGGELVGLAEPAERPGFLHPALVLK